MMRFATSAEFAAFLARGRAASQAVAAIVRPRKRRAHPEDAIQRAVCDFWSNAYPATWAKTFHCPNGLAAKNRKLAAIFAGLGVKPGVLDLLCIARRGEFNGFALELKSKHGRVSDSQKQWRAYLVSEGWSVGVANSLDVALALVRAYHRLPAVPPRVEHGKAERGATTRERAPM